MRHSCASFLLAQGVDARQVADVLGHAQVSPTLGTYAHVLPGRYCPTADAMEQLLSGE